MVSISEISAAKTATASLLDGPGSFRDLARKAAADWDAKEREIRSLIALPAQTEEGIAKAWQLLDREGAEWIKAYRDSIVHAMGGFFEVRRDGSLVEREPRMPDIRIDQRAILGLTLSLFKTTVASMFRSYADDHPEMQTAPPMAQRLALIAEAEREKKQIEELHSAIVTAAAKLGIQIPLLPSVTRQRDQAATKAQQAEPILLVRK